MSDTRLLVRASMKALVARFGCLEAAAETIIARWGGGVSKGTLSRKLNGGLDFTLTDVVALEDASGEYPVTKLLARRLVGRDKTIEHDGDLVRQGGLIARECGEAIAAILAAEQSSGANQRAEAITEIDEAVEALKAARAVLEARA